MGSSVAHYEVQGYPQENWTDQGFTAVRQLIVPWRQRRLFIMQMAGPPADLYPYAPETGARAINAACVPYQGERQIAASLTTMAAYEHAQVTLNYSTNAPQSNDLISEQLEPTVEFMTLDYEAFRWGSGSGDELLPNEAPSRLIRGFNYVLTFHQVPRIPAWVTSFVECVNASSFKCKLLGLTFGAETMLYGPPTMQRKITSQGAQAWSITCKFSYRANGWNKFFRGKTGQYEEIYAKGGSTAHKNFPTANFNTIFS